MRNFRNYEVWKDGVVFSALVYQLTEQFPKKEMYALCDQLQRASVSIPSNVAGVPEDHKPNLHTS